MRLDAESEIAQDLRPETIAQAHILESDQTALRPPRAGARFPRKAIRNPLSGFDFYRIGPAEKGADAGFRAAGIFDSSGREREIMVSDPLTHPC
jgi:hypothetical protein